MVDEDLEKTRMPILEPIGPGTVLEGRYRIVRKVGEGGMGTVYEASEISDSLDRSVAVKVLPPDLMRKDPTLERRFRAEIRIASKLEHPNIIPIYNVGRHGETPYFVMKFIRGRTLNRVLDGTDGLPPDELVAIATQVGRALAHIHAAGAIHRDIKSGNIMVDDAGHATLMDFGISKSEDSTLMTASGEIMGTGPYLAPEQWDGRTDARSDIWAFGVVLFEIATGRLPYRGKTIPELMNAILNKPVPSVAKERRDLPPAVVRAVEGCLEKDPERRFASMTDVLMALEGKGVTAVRPAPDLGPSEKSGDVTRALGAWEKARREAPESPAVAERFQEYTSLAEEEERAVIAVRDRVGAGDAAGARRIAEEFLSRRKSRRIEELIADLKKPEDAPALLAQARDRARDGDVAAAKKVYRRLLVLDPAHETARRELGDLDRRGRKRREGGGLADFAMTWGLRGAIALVIAAIFLPKFSPAAGSKLYETMGDAASAVGMKAAPRSMCAFAWYERALKYRPAGADSASLAEKRDGVVADFVNQGDAALAQGFFQLATDAFNTALRLQPSNAAALSGLKKTQAAIEDAKKAAPTSP